MCIVGPVSAPRARSDLNVYSAMHTLTQLTVIGLGAVFLAGCATSRHAVVEREHAWTRAMQAKDTAALKDIMAPDFRLTFEQIPPFLLTIDNGEPVPGTPRWRWIENTMAMSFGPIELYNIDTVEIADDMVAVNHWMYLEDWTEPDGTPIPPLYELTDIWLNRDGDWRVITRYSRPLDPDTPRPAPDYRITN